MDVEAVARRNTTILIAVFLTVAMAAAYWLGQIAGSL